MTRGGGQGPLRWLALAAWGLAWAWLILGLLLLGAWIAASVLVAALVGLWRVPQLEGYPRFEVQAAMGAMLGGVLWIVQPWVGSIEAATSGSVWPWQAAALLLLPIILATRERERRSAPWMGAIGWALGWLVPFAAAALAAGIGLPLTAPLAAVMVPAGILLLPIATVPFAVVAGWCRVLWLPAVLVLVAGSVALTALGSPDPVNRPISIVGPLLFGLGWLMAGATLFRLGPDRATGSV